MASTRGTVESVLREIAEALARLQERLQPEEFVGLLFELGIDDPPDLSADATLMAKVGAAANAASALVSKEEDLDLGIAGGDVAQVLQASAELLLLVLAVGDALDVIAADLPRASTGAPAEAQIAALSSEFTERVLGLVIARHLDVAHPVLESALRLLGVIERTIELVPLDASEAARVRRRLVFGRVPRVFSDPMGVLLDAYRWGAPDFKAKALLRNVADVFGEVGLTAAGLGDEGTGRAVPDDDPDVPALIDLFSVTVGGSSDPIPGLEAALFVDVAANQEIELGRFGQIGRIVLDLGGGYSEGVAAKLLPPLKLEIVPPAGGRIDGHLGVQFVGTAPDPAERIEILSIASGCTIDAGSVAAGLFADLVFSGTSARADFGLRAGIESGRLQVITDRDNPDGFLAQVLPPNGLAVDFDFGLRWTPTGGLQVDGNAGLEVAIPVNKSVAGLTFQALNLKTTATSQALALTAGVSVAASLGPVKVAIEGIGVRAGLDFATRGALGGAALDLKFQPPSGLGISIDAGSVSGGGFIQHVGDRYQGALELKVYSVAVKAFGVLETKLPNNQPGYSFAIVISAEFNPIQLGLGFTLNGVGGIIGINRRIDQDALAKGVRTGALERLLFPHDVVHDAPQIIHDLQAVLPATEGRYVFGPLAKIGWGTPTIIEAELGIILELPGPRLALLGEVSALLPKKDKGVITLNLSVAGLLDFPKKYFAIDASLHDSKVGSYPISGDMAMRLSWGDNPTFALAVGGFNPAFQPPAGFPALRRVAVDLGVSGNPSLTLQGYLALTSNTAQFGALAELNASGSGVTLYARVQFDALIVFSPFSFEVDISAQVSVKFHGRGITAHLRGMLSGPSPWFVRGEVCVSILWWDACLSFSRTFGSAQKVELPQLDPWLGTNPVAGSKEVLGLQEALQDARNWTPEPPPAVFAVVSLADSSADQLFDPLGVAVVKQTVCPFNLKLQRFGSAKAAGTPTFTLQEARFDGTLVTGQQFKKEPFAKAQYVELTAAQKLSAPAFEPFDGAIRLPANDNKTRAGSMAGTDITYKTKVLGAPAVEDHPLPVAHQEGMRRRSAAGLFGLRRSAAQAYLDPTKLPKFTVGLEEFVIGNKNTLTTQTGLLTSASNKLQAILALNAHLLTHPEDRDVLQVYPKFELGGR